MTKEKIITFLETEKEKETIEKLQRRFDYLYRDCKLACIQLDGFTHKIYFKDKDNIKRVNYFSNCTSEKTDIFNNSKARLMFIDMPNYEYQNNAKEYIFMDLKEYNE